MDGGDALRWSAVAEDWAQLWGDFAWPAWAAMVAPVGVGTGTRVLDIGCGAGDLMDNLAGVGAEVAGIDPAPGMVAHTRTRLPGADVRSGCADRLPWPAHSFDLVTSVNALQFADDIPVALVEFVRVTRPGGYVAVANWADSAHNDLDVVEKAVHRARGTTPQPDDPLRRPGGLDRVLADAGLLVVTSGTVEVVWTAADDESLIRGVLLGEEPAAMLELAPTVVAAASPMRRPDGSYHLVNAFCYATGRHS